MTACSMARTRNNPTAWSSLSRAVKSSANRRPGATSSRREAELRSASGSSTTRSLAGIRVEIGRYEVRLSLFVSKILILDELRVMVGPPNLSFDTVRKRNHPTALTSDGRSR